MPSALIQTQQPQEIRTVLPDWRNGLVALWNASRSLNMQRIGTGTGFGAESGRFTSIPGGAFARPVTLTGYLDSGADTAQIGYGVDGNTYFKHDGTRGLNTNIATKFQPNVPFTYLMIVRLRSNASVQGLMGCGNPGLSPIWTYGHGLVLDNSTLRAFGANGGSTNISCASPSLNEWHVIACRTNTSAGVIYVDGAKKVTGALAGAYRSYTAFGVGAMGNAAAMAKFLTGDIGLCGFWNRGLSDSELALLTESITSPWRMFAPLPRRLLMSAAAGGAYTLTADAGSYTIAGQDAALVKTRIVVADAGSYAVSGQTASVLVGHLVTADAGAYSIAGQDATLLRGRVVTADAGAYTINGQDAALTYVPNGSTYTLTADAGSYSLAGQDATLLKTRIVVADAGSYTVSGQDATLTYADNSLIGRKYPRRGRSRPRRKIIEDIPKVIKEIAQEKDDITEELAVAQDDLASVQLQEHNTVNRAEKIKKLTSAINSLESDLERVREEEALMLIAFMALEM